jgi:hypothetical protein
MEGCDRKNLPRAKVCRNEPAFLIFILHSHSFICVLFILRNALR